MEKVTSSSELITLCNVLTLQQSDALNALMEVLQSNSNFETDAKMAIYLERLEAHIQSMKWTARRIRGQLGLSPNPSLEP